MTSKTLNRAAVVLSNGGQYTVDGITFLELRARWLSEMQCAGQPTSPYVEPTMSFPTSSYPQAEFKLKDIVGIMSLESLVGAVS